MSVRLKLTLSYAAVILIAGALLLAVVWVFLLRYVPTSAPPTPGGFIPGRGDLIKAFVPAATWALVFLLLVGPIGGWVLAGRMLAPLDKIAKATRLTANGSLSHRVAMKGRGDEFRELADAFDDMLAQLEAHDAEQQRFAANASHELRTPLAITQTLLDVAANDPSVDPAELIGRLRRVNSRAIDLAEALLQLTQAEQRSFSHEAVDLSLLAEESVETLLPLAEKHGVAIESSGAVALTVGSRALLQQMTTNLVHNAIVHNLADDGIVLVSTASRPGVVLLSVENTGSILDPQLVSTLKEPFQRGTARLHADQVGAGLGLAIVNSIVNAHDGRLTLMPRESGGLRVTVELAGRTEPRASARMHTLP